MSVSSGAMELLSAEPKSMSGHPPNNLNELRMTVTCWVMKCPLAASYPHPLPPAPPPSRRPPLPSPPTL